MPTPPFWFATAIILPIFSLRYPKNEYLSINMDCLMIIPQQQAHSGLPAAKRQGNRQSRFWLWCNMRNPLLCSVCRHMAAANGFVVCTAHIIPHSFLKEKPFVLLIRPRRQLQTPPPNRTFIPFYVSRETSRLCFIFSIRF
ncbi:hypothetical protein B5F11_14605 [Anaerotruncus colihominis]|uniref:Uncharacterized protein n=1 Tax=Anaerotruncus colihominis TaxID=169435 RepID=A0A1Y4MJ68_9FIRM|nr:hypothetical protein B5F11_14605 [Anaerotruncus colihominis]